MKKYYFYEGHDNDVFNLETLTVEMYVDRNGVWSNSFLGHNFVGSILFFLS